MGRRSDIHWDAIEREYRLGMKTNRQLASEHGVQTSTIGRRAEKYEWLQDKSAEVRARSANMLVRATAGAAAAKATPHPGNATPSAVDVKTAATVVTHIILGHRKGLKRISGIRDKMLDEIEAQTSQIDLLTQIIEVAHEAGEGGVDKRVDLLRRIIALPSRVECLKKLTEIDEKIRKGEREAFGIEVVPAGDVDPLAALLARISGSAMPVVRCEANDDAPNAR